MNTDFTNFITHGVGTSKNRERMNTNLMNMDTTPKTIFLADDDDDDREIFAQSLKLISPGARLNAFADSSGLIEALHNCNGALPDLVFLDLNMPMKSGMDCLAEISADPVLRKLRVAVLSTSVNPKNIRDAYRLGASFYAVKPADFNSLSALISKIMYHDWQRARERNEFLLDYNPPGFRQVIWFQ